MASNVSSDVEHFMQHSKLQSVERFNHEGLI